MFCRSGSPANVVARILRAVVVPVSAIVVLLPALVIAQHLRVTARIVRRWALTSSYVLALPGYATATCVSGSCFGSASAPIAARTAVRGEELALRIPDGRVVLAVCRSKPNWTDWDQGLERDCRVPPDDEVRADISDDGVKLVWPVSLDGKKMRDETYRIIGVLGPAK